MTPPAWSAIARVLRRPRNRVLLGLFVLGVGVRIALPYVLRPLIVSQADAALVGRIALADLDLSLIRGGVTLHGLEVARRRAAAAGAAPGAPAPERQPPLFEAKRLWTQISWLALLRKTIDVEEFELEGFAVRLDRLKDGMLLPKPVPSEAPPEPEPTGAARLVLRRRQRRVPGRADPLPRFHRRRRAAALRSRREGPLARAISRS